MDGIVGAAARPPYPLHDGQSANTKTIGESINAYRWIHGDHLKEYGTSAMKWKAHTSTQEFADAFRATTAEFANNNDKRAAAIETFMLEEATKAGVIKVTPPRSQKNPNKWAKHLAPWFNENCRNAREAYRATYRAQGKKHASATSALQSYIQCCRESRAKMQFTLPDMLKQQPKKFWAMLKPR
jgi:hypothetical protein